MLQTQGVLPGQSEEFLQLFQERKKKASSVLCVCVGVIVLILCPFAKPAFHLEACSLSVAA